MATRNRTILFRKYRDALKSVRVVPSAAQKGIELVSSSLLNRDGRYTALSTEDPGASYSSGSEVVIGLPPAWVDVSEEVQDNIRQAQVKMAELSKAHSKALMPSFGDGKEDQHTIEALTHEITDLLKRSEKRLQRLAAAGPSEDSNVRKNVQRSLATDLQNLSMELRKKQSSYLKRLRQQKEGQDGIDLEMNLNGSKSRIEDEDLDDLGFNEIQLAKVKKNEVVESVNELAQIMKDLSVLVIDQGTIIDRIDYNIQNVAVSVEEGFKQLQKVEGYPLKNMRQGFDTVMALYVSWFMSIGSEYPRSITINATLPKKAFPQYATV
ncbi:Syntaxin-43-like protein [Drosera capensis]